MSDVARTRTGNFPIGLRRGWGAWQRDLDSFFAWIRANRFAFVDVGNDGDKVLPHARTAGIAIGSVDLPRWRDLLSANRMRRHDAVAEAAVYIERCASEGARRFLMVPLPEEPDRSREENFDHLVESYATLVPVLERFGASIIIEGWPGPGALCCTPETLRALFSELPSPAIGINYDPSHLLRMGIDPLRFLDEFFTRIRHVHAKDTALDAEKLYEFGHEQQATFAAAGKFGGLAWRYTIPGRGVMRWTEAFARLARGGYTGGVSIELEDDDFNGTDDGERSGLLLARDFLETC